MPHSPSTILVLGVQMGHRSLAQAAATVLKSSQLGKSNQIELIILHDKLFSIYDLFYKFLPNTFIWLFEMGKLPLSTHFFRWFYSWAYRKQIRALLKKHRPSIVVSSFFGLDVAVKNLNPRLPVVSIVPDPISINPILLSGRTDSYLVYNHSALELCRKINSQLRLVEAGWLVKPEFGANKNNSQIWKSLPIQPSGPTVLFVAGSSGMMEVMKVLQLLAATKITATLLVLCGRNQKLFDQVKNIRPSPNMQIYPLSFTEQVADLLSVCDLMVGKAGPNTLFECVTSHKPFFAFTHIPGQETGNLAIIEERGLGWVELNPQLAAQKIEELIARPELLHQFDNSIAQVADEIGRANQVLVSEVERLLPPNSLTKKNP